MIDPLKLFWVLTNSTYLVTKFIKTNGTDRNDTTIFFDKPFYEAEVDENEEHRQHILSVTAKDPFNKSPVRYDISSGNIGNAFAVNNSTGSIYVLGPLDYETRNKYDLILTGSNNRSEAYTAVTIHIKDVNDHPPIFERLSYKTQITEEYDRNLPKIILKVKAIDGDRDRPQDIIYFLTGQGIDPDNSTNSKFDIDKNTGDIYVLKPLDRDQPNGRPQWRFTVFAQDEGGDGLVGYADVQVNLKDINDNAPIFPQDVYFGYVTENGTAGMVIMTVTAVDYDDPSEGSNAKLTYSIENNVIDKLSGFPVFEIIPDTGVLKTAVCCIDREKMSEYSIKISVTDGGGLKSTATVIVKVLDINDNSPKFTKEEYFVEVDETRDGFLPKTPILNVTVQDKDENNTFYYNIVPSSGFGAERFKLIRNNDNLGSLMIVQPLDYEDPLQSNGFKFRIQVSDVSEKNTNKLHSAYSWVFVKLRDVNDNEPVFKQNKLKISVNENAEVGRTLGNFEASDLDRSENSKITYSIDRTSDKNQQFSVNQEGSVKIYKKLDREKTPFHEIKILAHDNGIPKLTSTATLTVIVQDINDNPPIFLENYRPIFMENKAGKKNAKVYATDKDDWTRGNGPPFKFVLDPAANDLVKNHFTLEQKTDSNGDNMAIVSTTSTFDREFQKEYHVPIVITDHGTPSMSGTSTLTIIIGDVNDNKMRSGFKEIIVYKYQDQPVTPTPIGTVFVEDPDDWDIADKHFLWDNKPHPKFILNEQSGIISINPGTSSGIYDLSFRVNDKRHLQFDVPAKVVVKVIELPEQAVKNCGSLRIADLTAEEFIEMPLEKIKNSSKSHFEKFRLALSKVFNASEANVVIFSVQTVNKSQTMTDIRFSVKSNESLYVNPVKLNGLVLIHKEYIENELGLTISMVDLDKCLNEEELDERSPCQNIGKIRQDLHMVNTNKTGFVGFYYDVSPAYTCEPIENFYETCYDKPCLNEARRIQTENFSSCRCQHTSRSFKGRGFAWYPRLQTCGKSHLHFEFSTLKPNGTLIYNGPIIPLTNKDAKDLIAVELINGFPRLIMDFGSKTSELQLQTAKTLSDGEWHRLDILWDTENVVLFADKCNNFNKSINIIYIQCKAQAKMLGFSEYLNIHTPLQVGGLYGNYNSIFANSIWKIKPNGENFDGCIRNLVYNSESYNLAEPALSENSYSNCVRTEDECRRLGFTCGEHGECISDLIELNNFRCLCDPSWTGKFCKTPSVPVSFKRNSYIKYALKFKLSRFLNEILLRFRTREIDSDLIEIADKLNKEVLNVQIVNSSICFFIKHMIISPNEKTNLCLSKVNISDGQWHVIRVNHSPFFNSLQLDDGTNAKHNETIHIDDSQDYSNYEYQEVLGITRQEELVVLIRILNGCLDNLQINNYKLPLSLTGNHSVWADIVASSNVETYCLSNSSCENMTCNHPFRCVDLWNKIECRCPNGQQISHDKKHCTDKDECLSQPCLNGGTCINLKTDMFYRCECIQGFWGKHCEREFEDHFVTLGLAVVSAVVVCLIFVIGFAVTSVFIQRKLKDDKRSKDTEIGKDKEVKENIITYQDLGVGNDDMTVPEITSTLQTVSTKKRINDKATQFRASQLPDQVICCEKPSISTSIQNFKNVADNDLFALPFDDLRNYAYEGENSVADSLSSLTSN